MCILVMYVHWSRQYHLRAKPTPQKKPKTATEPGKRETGCPPELIAASEKKNTLGDTQGIESENKKPYRESRRLRLLSLPSPVLHVPGPFFFFFFFFFDDDDVSPRLISVGFFFLRHPISLLTHLPARNTPVHVLHTYTNKYITHPRTSYPVQRDIITFVHVLWRRRSFRRPSRLVSCFLLLSYFFSPRLPVVLIIFARRPCR